MGAEGELLETLDSDWLANWIQPQHLSGEALQRFAQEFRSNPARVLSIPSFLVSKRATALYEAFREELQWRKQYCAYEEEPHDSEERWQATEEKRRFFRFSVGRITADQLTAGSVPYIRTRSAFGNDRMRQFFALITDLSLGPTTIEAHAMSPGDFLRPHNDVTLNRRVAFILYLTPEWDAAHGGSLQITHSDQKTTTTIIPRFNSLLLFDVHAHYKHEVQQITSLAPTPRFTLGGWFDGPQPSTP